MAVDRWWRFWRLSGQERGLLLRALLLLPLTGLAMRLVGFRRWQSMLSHITPEVTPSAIVKTQDFVEQAYRIARMVHAAERHGLGRPNCLRQSLVLWWLMRRRGIPGELRIGVRKQVQGFEAHAWVEHRGVVVNDTDEVHQHYAPFDGPIATAEAEPR